MAIRDSQGRNSFLNAPRPGGGSLYGGPPPPPPPPPAPAPLSPEQFSAIPDSLTGPERTAALKAAAGWGSDDGGGGVSAGGFGNMLKNGLGTVLGGAVEKLDWVDNLGMLAAEEISEAVSGVFGGADEFKSQLNADGTKNEFGKQSNWEKLSDPDYGFGKLMGGDVTDNKWVNRAIGFVGDVALSPFTYVGGGAVKSVQAVGKGGRSALALKAAELGMSDDIITSVSRYGPAFQSKAVRKQLNVKDAGIYFGVGEGSFKIPLTTPLGRKTEQAFALARDNTFGRAGKFRNAGRVGEAAAKRAIQTGRTIDSWTPAGSAKFLQNTNSYRASSNYTRNVYGREAQDMALGWSDKTLKGVTRIVENATVDDAGLIVSDLPTEAKQLVAFKNKLRLFAESNNVKIGDLGETYMPHRFTKESAEWLSKNKPDAYVMMGDLTDGAAATKKRKIVAGSKIEVHGELLEFETGTIDDIEKQFQKAFGGEAGGIKFMEDDAARLMDRYVGEIADSVAAVDMMKGAVARGDIGDLDAYSTEIVASAHTATKNEDMRKLLGDELIRRDEQLSVMQQEAWDLSQGVARALHKSADDVLRKTGDEVKELRDDLKVIRNELDSAEGDRGLIADQFTSMKQRAESKVAVAGRELAEAEESVSALKMQQDASDWGAGLSGQKKAALEKRHALLTEQASDRRAAIDEKLLEAQAQLEWTEKLEGAVAAQLAVADGLEEAADSPDMISLLAYQAAEDGVIDFQAPVYRDKAPINSPTVEQLERRYGEAIDRELDEGTRIIGPETAAMRKARRDELMGDASLDALDTQVQEELWAGNLLEAIKIQDELVGTPDEFQRIRIGGAGFAVGGELSAVDQVMRTPGLSGTLRVAVKESEAKVDDIGKRQADWLTSSAGVEGSRAGLERLRKSRYSLRKKMVRQDANIETAEEEALMVFALAGLKADLEYVSERQVFYMTDELPAGRFDLEARIEDIDSRFKRADEFKANTEREVLSGWQSSDDEAFANFLTPDMKRWMTKDRELALAKLEVLDIADDVAVREAAIEAGADRFGKKLSQAERDKTLQELEVLAGDRRAGNARVRQLTEFKMMDEAFDTQVLKDEITGWIADIQKQLSADTNRMINDLPDAATVANEKKMADWLASPDGTPEPQWSYGPFYETYQKLEDDIADRYEKLSELVGMLEKVEDAIPAQAKTPYDAEYDAAVKELGEKTAKLQGAVDKRNSLQRTLANSSKFRDEKLRATKPVGRGIDTKVYADEMAPSPQVKRSGSSAAELLPILEKVKRIEHHGRIQREIVDFAWEKRRNPKTMTDPREVEARVGEIKNELLRLVDDAPEMKMPRVMGSTKNSRGKELRSLAPVDDEEAEFLAKHVKALRGGVTEAQARVDRLKYEVRLENEKLGGVKAGGKKLLTDYEEEQAKLKALQSRRVNGDALSKEEIEFLDGQRYDKELGQYVSIERIEKPFDVADAVFKSTDPDRGVDDLDDYLARYDDVADRADGDDIIKSDPNSVLLAEGAAEDAAARRQQRSLERQYGSLSSPEYADDIGLVSDDTSWVEDAFLTPYQTASAGERLSNARALQADRALDGVTPDAPRVIKLKNELAQAEADLRSIKAVYGTTVEKGFGITDDILNRAAPDGVIGNILLFHSTAQEVKASGKKLKWLQDAIFETPQGLRDTVRDRFDDNWGKAVKANPEMGLAKRRGVGGKWISGFDDLTHTQAAEMLGGESQLRRIGSKPWNALPDNLVEKAVNGQYKELLRQIDPPTRLRLRNEAYSAAKGGQVRGDARAAVLLDELEGLTVRAGELDAMRDRMLDSASTMRSTEVLAKSARATYEDMVGRVEGRSARRRRKNRVVDKQRSDELSEIERILNDLPAETQRVADRAMEASIKLGDELDARVGKAAEGLSARENVVRVIGRTETARLQSFDAATTVKMAKAASAEETLTYLTGRQDAVKEIKNRLSTRLGQDRKKVGLITDDQLSDRLVEYGALLDEAVKNPLDMDLVSAAHLYDDWMKLSTKMERLRQSGDDLFEVYDAAKLGAAGKPGGLNLGMQRGLRDGFVRMRSELYPDVNGAPIDAELYSRLTNFMRQTEMDSEVKWLDAGTRFFKSYATATPGFHLRNWMGATFMNFSDDVSAKNVVRALKLWRAYAADPENFLNSYKGKDAAQVRDAFAGVFASGAGGSHGVSEIGSGLTRARNLVSDNAFLRKSRAFGEDFVEGPVRLAAALDATLRGGTMSDAASRVTRLHFDYSDLSNFDKKMKRVVPFWVFMSRNLPLQVEQMWRKPKAYSVYNHFMNNFASDEEGADDFLPKYLKDAKAVVTPFSWFGDSDKDLVFAPDLQHNNLMQDIMAFTGDGDEGIPIVDGLLSSGNPLVTKPLEIAFNHSGFRGDKAFYDQERDRYGNYSEKDFQQKALERIMYGLDGVFTPSGTAQGLLGVDVGGGEYGNERAQDKQLQKLLNVWGAPVKQLGDAERESERRRQRKEDAA